MTKLLPAFPRLAFFHCASSSRGRGKALPLHTVNSPSHLLAHFSVDHTSTCDCRPLPDTIGSRGPWRIRPTPNLTPVLRTSLPVNAVNKRRSLRYNGCCSTFYGTSIRRQPPLFSTLISFATLATHLFQCFRVTFTAPEEIYGYSHTLSIMSPNQTTFSEKHCCRSKGGSVDLQNIFYRIDGRFENILKPKMLYRADEFSRISKPDFIVQTGLKNLQSISKPYFIAQMEILKMYKNILTYILECREKVKTDIYYGQYCIGQT